MARQMKNINNGNVLRERVDSLRLVTKALLDEVKSLNRVKTIEVKHGINFDEEIKRFEIQLIERALEQTGGNQLRAAQLLNLKHTTLNAKIKRYDIHPFRI